MCKIALVTGGNQGIGFATVKILAQKGYTVYLGSRNATNGNEAVAKLQKEGLSKVKFLSLDVVSDDSVAKALKQFQSEQDHLDVLINNAGVVLESLESNALTTPVEKIKQTYEVNVFGAMRVTQAFLPLVQKSSLPIILNISSCLGSIAAQTDKKGITYSWQLPGYNTSKAAINAYTAAVASLVPNGKVNAIHPGHVQTNINGYTGTLTPEQSAEGIVKYGVEIDINGPSASFLSFDGSIVPW